MIRFIFLMFLSFAVSAQDIKTSWDATPFVIDGYRIYHSVNGDEPTVTDIHYGTNEYLFENVAQGGHELWIEGYKGDDVGDYDKIQVYYIGKVILTIRVTE